MSPPIWLFDLDNTLHDASSAVFGRINVSMTDYIVQHLAITRPEAELLRVEYWRRYGATLLGLEKHHGIRAAHFLAQTHELSGMEAHLHIPPADRAALNRLPGRKFVLTNAPAEYAKRVLTALDLASCFEGVISIEQMRVFGDLRPKPDARSLRHVLARFKLPAHRCVLVEDTLSNLKTAHALGLRTVWMQHYLGARAKARVPGSRSHGIQMEGRLHRRPAWVYARIRSLRALHAWSTLQPLP